MQFTSYLDDGKLTVALNGEIDHHTAKKYIRAISTKLEAYTPRLCILDFQDVTFMDSSGIAVVINALRQMRKMNGDLELCGLGAQPKKVFETSGVDKIIKIREVIL